MMGRHKLDRIVARYDISLVGSVPPSLSLLSFFALGLGCVALSALDAPPVASLILCSSLWITIVAVELARWRWKRRQPYVTPRWVRAATDAIGDEQMGQALARLVAGHRHDPDYVVVRQDLVFAIWRARDERRDAARRAEGLRLFSLAPPAPPARVCPTGEARRNARRLRERDRNAVGQRAHPSAGGQRNGYGSEANNICVTSDRYSKQDERRALVRDSVPKT